MRSISRRDFLQDSALLAATLAGAGILSESEAAEKTATAAARPAPVSNQVTLLGESGPPAWCRWQLRGADARTMLDRSQVFRVCAWEQPALLELLPNAPECFRLRAQVQHGEGDHPQGQVGIYFAHSKRPTVKGVMHCFFRTAFNDRVPSLKPRDEEAPTNNQVRLTLPIYREKEVSFSHQVDISCGISRQFTPAGSKVQSTPWRALEVEVTPEYIKTFWEGELIKTTWEREEADGCDPKKALELARFVLQTKTVRPKDQTSELLLVAAELALGKGVGLYVEKGGAAFRSVVIEPLAL